MPHLPHYLFFISFAAYLIFAAIEEFIPGFVSDYFNPHLLLIPVVAFLAALLILERGKPAREEPQKARGSGGLIVFAALATLALLWFGADELSVLWRMLVAVYGAILVAGILTVLFKD